MDKRHSSASIHYQPSGTTQHAQTMHRAAERLLKQINKIHNKSTNSKHSQTFPHQFTHSHSHQHTHTHTHTHNGVQTPLSMIKLHVCRL
ncbi:unnamed protein product [Heterobilharzia americana]|nr:unnamed protein product [Heterobilharzia americana]